MNLERQPGLPDAGAARRAFDRASASFDGADVVHSEARRRLLERLDLARLAPRVVIDLGPGTGKGALALARRYPNARVLAADSSVPMLELAQRRCSPIPYIHPVASDAQCLPLPNASVDLVFANLVLPWCPLEAVLGEAARVLADGGLLAFATLGPDTLQEVRNAWRSVDDRIHVHGLVDMHDVGDLAVRAGLAEPVLDVDRLEVTYPGLGALVTDLRACGAINVAVGRRTTLTGPDRWRRFERAIQSHEGERISTTVELIFGQAWGTGRFRQRGSGDGAVHVPLDEFARGLKGRR